jgi:transposase
MAVKRRVFSREFKLRVVREITAGKTQAEITREHQINKHLLWRWCQEYRQHKERAFAGKAGRSPSDETRIANLERMVGRLTMENDLLKKVLQKLEEDT